MPAVSEAQRVYLRIHFGDAWVHKHGFDNKGPLPQYVNAKAAVAAKQRHRKKRKPHLQALSQLRHG